MSGAPRPKPGQTQAEANAERNAKRLATAKARGTVLIGVKGHQHNAEVLQKKSESMKRWVLANPALAKARAAHANACWRVSPERAAFPRKRSIESERPRQKITANDVRRERDAVRWNKEVQERNRDLLRMFAVLAR